MARVIRSFGEVEEEVYFQYVGGLTKRLVRELGDVSSAISARPSSFGLSAGNQRVYRILDGSAHQRRVVCQN